MRAWLGACLLLALASAAPAMADLAAEHAARAQRLAAAGRRLDALAELDAALALQPGQAQWQAQRQALQLTATAAAATPQALSPAASGADLAAWLDQARRDYRASDLAGAEAAWRQALLLQPGQEEAQQGLDRLQREAFRHDPDQPFDKSVGDLYDAALREMRKGRLVEARQRLDDALALNPVQAQIQQALGWVEAGALAQQGGRDAQAWLADGRRLAAQGEDAKAAAALQGALSLDPGLAGAAELLEQVRQRNAGKVEALLKRGRAAAKAKDWAGAEQAYGLALALDGKSDEARAGQEASRRARDGRRDADSLYNQGVDAWQAGDLAQAAARFRQALRAQPGDAAAATALASVQQKLEQRSDQGRTRAAASLAEAQRLEAAGALDEALRQYQRAADADPGLTEAGTGVQRLEKRIKGL